MVAGLVSPISSFFIFDSDVRSPDHVNHDLQEHFDDQTLYYYPHDTPIIEKRSQVGVIQALISLSIQLETPDPFITIRSKGKLTIAFNATKNVWLTLIADTPAGRDFTDAVLRKFLFRAREEFDLFHGDLLMPIGFLDVSRKEIIKSFFDIFIANSAVSFYHFNLWKHHQKRKKKISSSSPLIDLQSCLHKKKNIRGWFAISPDGDVMVENLPFENGDVLLSYICERSQEREKIGEEKQKMEQERTVPLLNSLQESSRRSHRSRKREAKYSSYYNFFFPIQQNGFLLGVFDAECVIPILNMKNTFCRERNRTNRTGESLVETLGHTENVTVDKNQTKSPEKTQIQPSQRTQRGETNPLKSGIEAVQTNKEGEKDHINKRGEKDHANKRGDKDQTDKGGEKDQTNKRGEKKQTKEYHVERLKFFLFRCNNILFGYLAELNQELNDCVIDTLSSFYGDALNARRIDTQSLLHCDPNLYGDISPILFLLSQEKLFTLSSALPVAIPYSGSQALPHQNQILVMNYVAYNATQNTTFLSHKKIENWIGEWNEKNENEVKKKKMLSVFAPKKRNSLLSWNKLKSFANDLIQQPTATSSHYVDVILNTFSPSYKGFLSTKPQASELTTEVYLECKKRNMWVVYRRHPFGEFATMCSGSAENIEETTNLIEGYYSGVKLL